MSTDSENDIASDRRDELLDVLCNRGGRWPADKPHSTVALIPCRDCGKTVSRNASACPHCGSKAFDVGHAIEHFGIGWAKVGFYLLVIALCLFLFGYLDSLKP